LEKLEYLDISNGYFTSLPDSLETLQNLKSLNLSGNHLTGLKGLGRLENLVYLDLGNCGLDSLPDELENLRSLRTLNLSGNLLSSIPAVVFKLRSLETLDISNNKISKIGNGIDNLTRISTLLMAGNGIRYLPRGITKLPHLDSVDLRGNILLDENLDSGVVAWLSGKVHAWRRRASDRELTGFIRELGRALLQKDPDFSVELGNQEFLAHNTWPDAIDFIKIPPKRIAEMLAKADSQSLSQAVRKIARLDSFKVSPREMVRGLLSAYAFLEQHPEILDIIAYEVGKYVACVKKSGESKEGCGELVSLSYPEYFQGMNQKLYDYAEVNRMYLLFWGERQRDKSISQTHLLIDRMRQYCFPMVSPDSVDLHTTPPPPPIRPVYFSDRTFGDPDHDAFHPGFAFKEDILLHYLKEVYPKKCDQEWKVVKDPNLWQNLVSLRTPYFDTSLIYFSLTGDQNHQYAWKETGLVPELHVKFFTCLDYAGFANLITHLVFTNPEKTRNRIFAGIPRVEYIRDNKKPQGYFLSKKIEEHRESGALDSEQIVINMTTQALPSRRVTKTYSVPRNCPNMKSLLVEDLYLGQNWGNLNFNPKSERYEQDTELLAKSMLYAVYPSGDSVALNADSSYWNGWIDGGGEMFGAYTLTPRFTDLNGDGRFDLIVDTRAGTRFFFQKDDGHFQKQE
jgi:hypothetical protein